MRTSDYGATRLPPTHGTFRSRSPKTGKRDCGGQGVHREVESEGHEEKYRAVIDGGCPADEPVGQRWGKVEPALWRRRRSHSPTAPRCLRTARYGKQCMTSGGLTGSPGGTAPEPVRFDGRGSPESLSEFSVPLLPNTPT
jgi:hypothetical protein